VGVYSQIVLLLVFLPYSLASVKVPVAIYKNVRVDLLKEQNSFLKKNYWKRKWKVVLN